MNGIVSPFTGWIPSFLMFLGSALIAFTESWWPSPWFIAGALISLVGFFYLVWEDTTERWSNSGIE